MIGIMGAQMVGGQDGWMGWQFDIPFSTTRFGHVRFSFFYSTYNIHNRPSIYQLYMNIQLDWTKRMDAKRRLLISRE